MRRYFTVLFLMSSLLWPAFSSAQAQDAKSDLGANAAMKYWQAFGLMPTLDKDQEKLLSDWYKVPLDDAALKLIKASEKSRLYLHRGAKLSRCDWSLDWDDGMDLMLPYLAKSRDLARLAALHGRYEFEQGHWEAGTEDAIAILTLARHVGKDPTMIGILVRNLIEWIAIDLVAPYLPELQGHSAKIIAAYEKLPPGATLSQAYLTEKQYFVLWLIKKVKAAEAKQKGAWRDMLKGAFDEGPESLDVLKQITTFEQAIKLMEDVLPVSDQMAKLVALPKPQFDAQYPEFKKKTKADNLLAGPWLSAADKILANEYRNQAKFAMLKAAIAVAQGGQDKLKDIKDPFGSGPFEYRALDKGFELKSKLLFEDKPVTLTVGERKK